ncbi:MAG: D-amino acid aminotransferase [Desulfatirhabdiaceae bacterium]
MPELAYVNGDIMPIENAMIPIEDRGNQFGDAVYEVIASRNGRLFCMEEHLNRLERSMRELSLPVIPRDAIEQAILNLFAQAQIPRAALYIQISRGVSPRNHGYPENPCPMFIMTIRPVKDMPESCRTEGVGVITAPDIRWGRCDIKTVQLLPNIMAKQRAIESGAADAIFVSADGIAREGTSSNLFVVRNNRLITHPLTPEILGGITRIVILDLCKSLNIPVEERRFHQRELFLADEVFFTGTISEILPIVRIDGKTVGAGRVGPISSRLYQMLLQKMSG